MAEKTVAPHSPARAAPAAAARTRVAALLGLLTPHRSHQRRPRRLVSEERRGGSKLRFKLDEACARIEGKERREFLEGAARAGFVATKRKHAEDDAEDDDEDDEEAGTKRKYSRKEINAAYESVIGISQRLADEMEHR